jgi:RNA polymerase sigma factor (sigma-70 family)
VSVGCIQRQRGTEITRQPRQRSAEADGSLTDLINAAAAGDERAWEMLVARFRGLVWSIVNSYRLEPADAADVVQTTWLRLVQHIGRIHQPLALGGWLATTARRECLRALRLAGREQPTEEQYLEVAGPPEADPQDHVVIAETDRVLWESVDRLSPRCRKLLRLLMADPRPSYRDISASLNMPIGSIGPSRARCLACLRRTMVTTSLASD